MRFVFDHSPRSAMSRVSWIGFSALALALIGAGKSSNDGAVGLSASGGAGTARGVDLDVGNGGNAGKGGTGEAAGAAGQIEGPKVAGCDGFVGLDECGVTSVE